MQCRWFSCTLFVKYAQILHYGGNLSALNTFMNWTVIGRTQEKGYAIHVATIRNPKNEQKRAIFIDACMLITY